MIPDDLSSTDGEDAVQYDYKGLSEMVKEVRTHINTAIDLAGMVGDLCTTGDGSGMHGLQMSYDRLKEAKHWLNDALEEIARGINV